MEAVREGMGLDMRELGCVDHAHTGSDDPRITTLSILIPMGHLREEFEHFIVSTDNLRRQFARGFCVLLTETSITTAWFHMSLTFFP